MASIKSQLSIGDGMTGPLRHINTALSLVLDSFEQVQRTSGNVVNTTALQEGRAAILGCNTELDKIEANANAAAAGQSKFNNRLREGYGLADGLGSKIKGFVATLGLGAAVAKTVQLSDQVAGNRARLSLMVDDGGSVAALEQKIFASAQNSRGAYLDTMGTVSKMGILAGNAFTGNDEVIRFTELLNKNFVIAGASASESQNAMYQLTQAMASGRLQGDEFRSIRENAPLLAQSIEAYMTASGVPGTMKEWAAEGMITGEVIKAALFSTADDVNARFEQMPMTWGQAWTSMQNRAIVAMDPVLSKINALANNQDVQVFIDGLINGFATLMVVVLGAFEIMGAIAGFFYNNWSIIEPIIWGVVAAVAAYSAALLIYNGYLAISTGLEKLAGIQKAVHAAATMISAGATFAATAAQHGFNAALLACPLTWILIIIIAIIAIIYAVVAAINHFAGTSLSATGIIAGVFAVAFAAIGNTVLGVVNFIIGLGIELYNLIGVFANFLANIFSDPVGAIINLFAGMFDFILGIVQAAAKLIDTVLGSDMSGAVEGFRSTVADKVAEIVGDQVEVMPKLNASDYQLETIDYGGAWDAGYAFGEGVEDTVGGLLNFGGAGDEFSNPDWDAMGNGIADTANNTGATADALSATTEDLKYLRDLAEQEAINRFTTAEVKIDMTGMTNKIDSSMDMDSVITELTDGFTEALVVAAEGVHV